MSARRGGGRSRTEAVGRLVAELLKQRGMEGKLREFRIWQVWQDAVGPQIAGRTNPIRIRDGVLEVRVDHPVWMQQLQMLKPRILANLNQRLGEQQQLRDLFLRLGKVQRRSALPERDTTPPPWTKAELSAEEEEQIERQLAHLEDAELRRRVRRLMLKQARLDKTRPGDEEKTPETS